MISYDGLTVHRDGSVPRGWQRWERASRNAAANPNSHGAKLYRKRLANADQVARDLKNDDIAWEWIDWNGKRDGVTCSTVCTVMQLQLEQSDDYSQPGLVKALRIGSSARSHGWASDRDLGRKIDISALRRQQTCRVCGKKIGPAPKSKPAPLLGVVHPEVNTVVRPIGTIETELAATRFRVTQLEIELQRTLYKQYGM